MCFSIVDIKSDVNEICKILGRYGQKSYVYFFLVLGLWNFERRIEYEFIQSKQKKNCKKWHWVHAPHNKDSQSWIVNEVSFLKEKRSSVTVYKTMSKLWFCLWYFGLPPEQNIGNNLTIQITHPEQRICIQWIIIIGLKQFFQRIQISLYRIQLLGNIFTAKMQCEKQFQFELKRTN